MEWYHPFSGHGWIDFEIEAFGYSLIHVKVRPRKWQLPMVLISIGAKVLGRSMYGNPSSVGEAALSFCIHEPHALAPGRGWLTVFGRSLWG